MDATPTPFVNSPDENRFRLLMNRFLRTEGLSIKSSFYFQELLARFKQKTFSLDEICCQLEALIEKAVMPNAAVLEQYINQLLDLRQFSLAYMVYQLALKNNLADKYIFSGILRGLSKMSVTNEDMVLAIYERAKVCLGELNEFHYSYTIAALAKVRTYNFSNILEIYKQAQHSGKCNRYVFLNLLNALEHHPSLSFSLVNQYWQQYKKQKNIKSSDSYNQFLILFSKLSHISCQIFEEIFQDAQQNRLTNYSIHLRTFLGLLETSHSSTQILGFYQLITSKFTLPYWVHHRLFSALVKFENLTAKEILDYLKVENIKETHEKSGFYMEMLYILNKSKHIFFNDIHDFYLRALPLCNLNSSFYNQFLDLCGLSFEVDLEKLYQIFLESITNSCGSKTNFSKVLKIVDKHQQLLDIQKFIDFILNDACRPYLIEEDVVFALQILEKTSPANASLFAAANLYQAFQSSSLKITGALLNFFMRGNIDTKYATLLMSLLAKLKPKQAIEGNPNIISLQNSTAGQVYFGVLEFILHARTNPRGDTSVTFKFYGDYQLMALKKVLNKLKHDVENQTIRQNEASVEFTVKSFYNKKYSMGERSGFSPYLSKK